MKIELTDYQRAAFQKLTTQIRDARSSVADTKHAFILSAPTGAGKTAIVTAVMEAIADGDGDHSGDPDATFLWVTDAPELNAQTRKKILSSSEIFSFDHLETVDATFDQPTFDRGKVYFLNTQKLGQATSFTQTGDNRTHSLWDTIWRTAKDRPASFYLVLDEAHKGLGHRAAEVLEATTIVQRLIMGDAEEIPPALLIGVSATPQRFTDLLERATDRVRWPTHVRSEDAQDSGLIKDEIVLWHTRSNGKTEWALLRQASEKLAEYERAWSAYCNREQRDPVKPILVVQVTDGRGSRFSNTKLDAVIEQIESVLGRLSPDALVHCFQDTGAIELAPGRTIRKIQPSDIQDDEAVRVVLFKMALNTGWDCPRAEVMMSFRKAVDSTLIAQLVGRMVRTPEARRIPSDRFLNSVSLYLPNWDDVALERVITHLTQSDEAIPVAVERGENLALYKRARRSKDIFGAITALPTYPTRRVNKDSNVKRLMQLSRYLANDEIQPDALEEAKELLLGVLGGNRVQLKPQMKRLRDAIKHADLVESRLAIGAPTESVSSNTGISSSKIRLVEQDVVEAFRDAGRRLGGGLQVDYVARRVAGSPRRPSTTEARAEFCALVHNRETQEALEQIAGQQIKKLWADTHSDRLKLSPERRTDYARVNRMAFAPMAEEIDFPSTFVATKGPKVQDRHLFTDASGDFYPSPRLNQWEERVLKEELKRKDFRRWLRNPVRKDWSLGIPYEETGTAAVMYPDFLIFRSAPNHGIVVDILEPHAPHAADIGPKLKGLCKFAEQHGDHFGRIELILLETAKGQDKLLRIDVNNPDIRDDAKLLTESKQISAFARKTASGK